MGGERRPAACARNTCRQPADRHWQEVAPRCSAARNSCRIPSAFRSAGLALASSQCARSCDVVILCSPLATTLPVATGHLRMDLYRRTHAGQLETTYVNWAQKRETQLAGQSSSAEQYRDLAHREIAALQASAAGVEARAQAQAQAPSEAHVQAQAYAQAHAAQQAREAAHVHARAAAAEQAGLPAAAGTAAPAAGAGAGAGAGTGAGASVAAPELMRAADFRAAYVAMARPYLSSVKGLLDIARLHPQIMSARHMEQLERMVATTAAIMQSADPEAPLPSGVAPHRSHLAQFEKRFTAFQNMFAAVQEKRAKDKAAREAREAQGKAERDARARAEATSLAAEEKRKHSLLVGAAAALAHVCKRTRPETALDVASDRRTGMAAAEVGAHSGGARAVQGGAGAGSELPLWRPSDAEVARVGAVFPGYYAAVGVLSVRGAGVGAASAPAAADSSTAK